MWEARFPDTSKRGNSYKTNVRAFSTAGRNIIGMNSLDSFASRKVNWRHRILSMQWCWMWDAKFFCKRFQKLHTPAHIAKLHGVARFSSQVSMSARNWTIFVQGLFHIFQGFLPDIINVTESSSTDVLCLERIIEQRVLSFPSACFSLSN